MKKKRLSLLLADSSEESFIFISDLLNEIENCTFLIERLTSPEQISGSTQTGNYDICILSLDRKQSSAKKEIRLTADLIQNKPLIVLSDKYSNTLDMETLQSGGADYLSKDDLSPRKLERSILYAIRNHEEEKKSKDTDNFSRNPFENSERPFRTLIEQSPLSIMIFSRDGKITFINDACEKLFGVGLKEINGYNILEDKTLIEKGAMSYIKKAFAGETTRVPAIKYHPAESQLSSAFQSDRWIHSFIYPVKDKKGNLSEVIVMHEDVTVSKKSEEATFHHLEYLHAMERINSISFKANSVDEMLKGVLDEMLLIFKCDRAYLLYPCAPEAKSWRVPMESYRPAWPGANILGIEMPMDKQTSDLFRLALETLEPLVFDATTDLIDPTPEQFHTKAQIAMAVFPKKGSAWVLGIHHCANDHIFSKQEIDIFNGIGHRVGESITSFLTMQDLKESEERFRTLVENAPEAIVVYDVDKKRYIDANRNALNLFKRSYEDLLHINPLDATPLVQSNGMPSIDMVRENIRKAMGGQTPVFEWSILDSEGKEIPCEIRLARLPAAGKRLIRGSITDISARKKVEESLRQLSSAVEQSPASIVITNIAGNIEYVNPRFTQVTGYSLEEAIGQKPNIIKSGEHKDEFYSNIWQTITSGNEWRGELLNRKKNGQLFWERASISPIVDSNGVIRNFLAVKEDITEKIRLEKDAMRAAHLASLGELAAGVAHEINNPVNSIINFSKILADKNKDNSVGLDICNRMIKEGKRIASIVRNLLSFAREGEGQKEHVILADILADTLALCRLPLRKAHINVEVNIAENFPSLVANKHQLQQVFLNIITNAQYALNEKYQDSMKRKSLIISAKKTNGKKQPYLRIVFHDNGTGIPARIKDKILDPFFSTKPINQGTGLGLSISHGIIEDHKGKISFDSKEGEYTKTIIDLPITLTKNDSKAP